MKSNKQIPIVGYCYPGRLAICSSFFTQLPTAAEYAQNEQNKNIKKYCDRARWWWVTILS